ncbi:hypothetical protein MRS44_002225 [Fusarium solani]|jgi:hypothetical protein|uniref:uncharacterized protein n=1 Tax=Fusarium solani TaxID=169388 RepID=UPI0032C3F67E|nr:hypothetical protein MRS44_002225 [Fusarium solani]
MCPSLECRGHVLCENTDQKLDDELGRPEERGRRALHGREKNIIIKVEFKEKPILLKGAPRGMSIKENMPMRAGALVDYLGLRGTKTDPEVMPRNGQPTVGNHLRCCHGRLLEKPI